MRDIDNFAFIAQKASMFVNAIEYITAAEHAIGRRLSSVEVDFLIQEARDASGNRSGTAHVWPHSIGHPAGKTTRLPRIQTFFASRKKSEEDILDRADREDKSYLHERKTPKIRGPRPDLRRKFRFDLDDPDLKHHENEKNKDRQSGSIGEEKGKESLSLLLHSNNKTKDFNSPFKEDSSMKRFLNSSREEVSDLIRVVKDRPKATIALARMMKMKYPESVAMGIIKDARIVGVVRMTASGRLAANEDKIPERLNTNDNESQDAASKIQDGAISYQSKYPFDEDQQLAVDLEKGKMQGLTPPYQRALARVAKGLKLVAQELRALDRKIAEEEADEAEAPEEKAEGTSLEEVAAEELVMQLKQEIIEEIREELADIIPGLADAGEPEKDDGAEAPVSDSEMDDVEMDEVDFVDEFSDVEPSKEEKEAEAAFQARARRASRARAAAGYGSDAMDMAMGHQPTYDKLRKKLETNREKRRKELASRRGN